MVESIHPARDPFPPKVMDELRYNLLRVQPYYSAVKLWEEVLNESEQQQLGADVNEAYAQGGTTGMWMRLHDVSQPRAIVELAFELRFLDERMKKKLLRQINELPDSIEEAILRAVKSHALVLVERDRAAYWRGARIDIDWNNHSALWNFLWVLSARGQGGGAIDHTHFADGVEPSYPSKVKSRLRGMASFPTTLVNRIKVAGRGAQQLDLPADKIRLFSITTVEVLSESIAALDR